MTIRVYNSMSREIEDFTPINPDQVTMYVCGPTLYDRPHLGNARPAIVFDTLNRLLSSEFKNVIYARNWTDIDDKIIAGALAAGEDIDTYTFGVIIHYSRAMEALNVAKPDTTPYATRSMESIRTMILQLVMNKHAYVSEGHVLFDISSWPAHGRLSGHLQEDLQAGQHRITGETMSYKRNPGDFVLWKPAKPGEPSWPSPYGPGRPGWHIECSAMIHEVFEGKTIDIHGGGGDLRFPHHECEISQFEAACLTPLANYWMHNAMLLIDGQKMAKSAGNYTTVDDVLNTGVHGSVIRMAMLMTHYRSPLDWTSTLLVNAQQTLTGWHMALEYVEGQAERNEHSEAILGALASDLNTPLAITRIHDKMSQLARDPVGIAAGVRFAASIMGLDLTDNENYLRGGPSEWKTGVEALVQERMVARAAKDFAESDRLRALLADSGIVIEDGPGGTRWRRK
jgi:cysteinyl-tRNA synthetase